MMGLLYGRSGAAPARAPTVLVAAALFCSPPALVGQAADTAWPMFGHDMRHTWRSPHVGPESPAQVWRYETEPHIESPAAVGSDGKLYVGSSGGPYAGTDDHYLYALAPEGSLIWRYRADGSIEASPAIGSDGTIYMGSNDGFVYAVTPGGALKWKYATGDRVRSSPAIGLDGTIYVGSGDHGLYALTPEGSLIWKFETEGEVHTSPAIGSDGTIYVGSEDEHLYAVAPDGSLKWSYGSGGPMSLSPALGPDGAIYSGSMATGPVASPSVAAVHCLRPDGTLRWQYATPHRLGGGPTALGIGADGTVYVAAVGVESAGSSTGRVTALGSDGTPKWTYDTSDPHIWHLAVAGDGTILCGSGMVSTTGGGRIWALRSDGTLRWSLDTDERLGSSPVIAADGRVYVGLRGNGYGVVLAVGSAGTAVSEEAAADVPAGYRLSPSVPNPFNSSTVIRFALPRWGPAEVAVYNLGGRRVATLAAGVRAAGAHAVRWDGRDDRGQQAATGVYLYRFRCGHHEQTRKLLLLR